MHTPGLLGRRRGFFLLFLTLVASAGCRPTDLRIWHPGAPPPDACAVEHHPDIAYRAGPVVDAERCRLDLFLPKGVKDYPVVVFVHGGAWIIGDNRCCGLCSSVAELLARNGVGVAAVNYRLSPTVQHPEHIKDVARACAWTYDHIAEYGGDPQRLFLLGHSAGGHLVSLLATDEQYLRVEGMRTGDIRGVISVSGVYRIPTGKMGVYLGGEDERSFRLSQMLPLRGGSGANQPWGVGLPLQLNVFGPAFGDDPQVRKLASPIHQVRPNLPPFLLFTAERDLPTLPLMAGEFQQALLDQGNRATLRYIADRNHNSIMYSAVTETDPVGQEILSFIRQGPSAD